MSASSRNEAWNELRARVQRVWRGRAKASATAYAVLVEIAAEVSGIVRLQGDEQAALDQLGERVVGEVGDDAEAGSRFVVATGVYSTRNVAWQARHWAEIA